jgi:hypothetical protein
MARIVARNRRDLERALSPITSELLKEKGYLCFVDIFMKLGYLSQVDYTYCLPLSRFRWYAVISITSDEHPVVARPWPGGEKRISGRASHQAESAVLGAFLLPYAATGVALIARGCLSGATPRGSAVDDCRDTTAGARQAERAADGGVVDVPRALAGSPRAS